SAVGGRDQRREVGREQARSRRTGAADKGGDARIDGTDSTRVPPARHRGSVVQGNRGDRRRHGSRRPPAHASGSHEALETSGRVLVEELMNCQSLRNWLLQVDSLQPKDWPAEVANHLKSCARCVKYVNALSKLEKSWREQPLPADCARAKAAFLNVVTTLARKAEPRPVVRRWHPARWGAAAAMVLVVLGILAWLALSPSEIRASEVVDQLVDWNTDLARADFPKRKPILDANEETFRK